MQRQDLIPTPLFAGTRPPVEIVETIAPGPFRALRVVGFILSISWLYWKTTFLRKIKGQTSTRAAVSRYRVFLERMGGMWVKAGQLVAMRRDIFHQETCDELSRLQDRAQGFAWPLVRRIVEEDLGGPIERFFSEFSERPIAAASIGQTHEARLRHNGVRVAVKVQRPFVAESFARDLRYTWFLVFWLKWFSVAPQARWYDMVWELEKALNEELDYRMEATALARMKKSLRKHQVYAPKVYLRFSSKRVLVMEFVEGVFMSDYIKMAGQDPERLQRWLAENEIEPRKVGERLMVSHLRQLFEDNIYHGDLHPGNIILQRKNRLALIDFGTIGTFDKSLLQKYHLMFAALGANDFMKVADMFLLTCPPLPNRDMAELKSEIIRALRLWEARTKIKRLPYHEKSLTSLSGSFAQLLGKFSVPSNWEFLRLNRSDLTMDASLMFLLPDIDYPALFRKYEHHARARSIEKATSAKAWRNVVGNLLTGIQVPAMQAENLYFESEWIRKRALGFEGRISKFAHLMSSALSLFTGGTFILGLLFFGQYLRYNYGWHVRFLETPWLDRVFEALPVSRPGMWFMIALVALYVARHLRALGFRVEEKEYDRAGR